MEIKVGQLVHYMNQTNCICRGKIAKQINNRLFAISNCNYIVSRERIFENDDQVSKFFNLTKGWTKSEKYERKTNAKNKQGESYYRDRRFTQARSKTSTSTRKVAG